MDKRLTDKNRYAGKKFSVIGDSISALEGTVPDSYKIFYNAQRCKKAEIKDAADMWWGKVIGFFGGELLVNNSWSGSLVVKVNTTRDCVYLAGVSDERTSSLGKDGAEPDVIIIYLGTNDWIFHSEPDSKANAEEKFKLASFPDSYRLMLDKLQKNYPNAEIWCCTLCTATVDSDPNFKCIRKHWDTDIEVYNEIIRSAVKEKNCNLIDLASYDIPYDSIDGAHPTSKGMEVLSQMIIEEMLKGGFANEEKTLCCL